MTPAMSQFVEIKSQYPDHIVLFRMGDFYETFYEDAKKASKILSITLTARDKERKVPMAGIPFHALESYLPKLLEVGERVVLVEQLEDPKKAKGVVKRGIIKIFTPGTTYDTKNPKNNVFLASIDTSDGQYQFAFTDINDGKIYYSLFSDEVELINNILLINPKEIVIRDNSILLNNPQINSNFSKELMQLADESFDDNSHSQSEIKVVNAIYNYLKETEKTDLKNITEVIELTKNQEAYLDAASIRNLEILSPLHQDSISLFEVLDNCSTIMGSRKLRQWLIHPLLDKKEIISRQNHIETFRELEIDTLQDLSNYLKSIYDLGRISNKIALNNVNARELRNLYASIETAYNFVSTIKGQLDLTKLSKAKSLIQEIEKIKSIISEINTFIVEEPPITVREGGMIRPEINNELNELHQIKYGGKEWIKQLEINEIKNTGINTLKVRFNKVFGFYIEIPSSQIAKVPEHYIRKQTLKNNERFITEELKEYEIKVLSADEKIAEIEYEFLQKLIQKLQNILPEINSINHLIAEVDIYMNVAIRSLQYSWSKPVINSENTIELKSGRHPILEEIFAKESRNLVSNSFTSDKSHTFYLVTGPNMGGKSTFLRQNIIILLLAQIGFYVPAESLNFFLADKFFTRIGASDNLAKGSSTFMMEMTEAANILNNATSKSIVVLDEVGRGTSTFDGMSIAWAICEFLAKKKTTTLFATHYHELTELSNKFSNVHNLYVKVAEYNNEIIFLYQVEKGKADKSYGIHVAKLAKVPDEVISSASKVLKRLEKEKNKLQPEAQDLFENENKDDDLHKIIKKINEVEMDKLSPIEAWSFLQSIKDETS